MTGTFAAAKPAGGSASGVRFVSVRACLVYLLGVLCEEDTHTLLVSLYQSEQGIFAEHGLEKLDLLERRLKRFWIEERWG